VLIQFLGLVRARSAVVAILEAGRDEALAQVALGALAEIGSVAADELDAAWTSFAQERRRAACEVLGRVGGPRAIERLIAVARRWRSAAARRSGARARRAARREGARAARAATRVRGARGRARRRERAHGVDRRRDRARGSRCAGPLSRDRSARAVELLAAAVTGAGDEVRLSAARALGRIARREDAALVALLMKDPSARVRRAAVDAIARLEPDRTPEPLHLAIADESASVRVAAARALGASRSDSVFDDLRRLAEDEDVRVRATAVHAIGMRFASDGDPAVRAAALAVLGRACEDVAPVALAVAEAVKEIGGEASGYVIPLLGVRSPRWCARPCAASARTRSWASSRRCCRSSRTRTGPCARRWWRSSPSGACARRCP
jgi:HEAT repeat protein